MTDAAIGENLGARYNYSFRFRENAKGKAPNKYPQHMSYTTFISHQQDIVLLMWKKSVCGSRGEIGPVRAALIFTAFFQNFPLW